MTRNITAMLINLVYVTVVTITDYLQNSAITGMCSRLKSKIFCTDKLDCAIISSHIRGKQSTKRKWRGIWCTETERAVHDSSIHPHPHSQKTECGWGMVGAGRISDLAFLPLYVKRCGVVPCGVPYWGSAVGDLRGCLFALLMKRWWSMKWAWHHSTHI